VNSGINCSLYRSRWKWRRDWLHLKGHRYNDSQLSIGTACTTRGRL
jgi:hypothetical protein